MKIRPDALAYWYLRLNGFLTIQNFVVHPDFGTEQRTDVDIIAVRFPFRAELPLNSMQDDVLVQLSPNQPVFLIVEVKEGLCDLNGAWTDKAKQNMQRVIRAIGITPTERESKIASDLYDAGRSTQEEALISLACFGGRVNKKNEARLPAIPQIIWRQVTDFIFDRFTTYYDQKKSHGQWDDDGLNLWNTANACEDASEFRAAIKF